MKNLSTLLTVVFALLTSITFAQVSSYQVLSKKQTQAFKPHAKVVKPTSYGKFVYRPNCADPMAAEIKFQKVAQSPRSRFKGKVKITGIVTNNGRKHFRSGAGQQIVKLYEIVPGAAPRLVASKPFGTLVSGGSVAVSFTRWWYSASPAEGEFPPSYRVCIDYDPDIYIDGNTQNDDCNQRNNCKERSGSAINQLF